MFQNPPRIAARDYEKFVFLDVGGSCKVEVEFEFTTWAWVEATTHHCSCGGPWVLATAHCHSGSGRPSFLYLLTYANECKWVDHNEFWVDWVYCFYEPGDRTRKPPPITVPAVAWTQAQEVNSNSTSSGKETRMWLLLEHICYIITSVMEFVFAIPKCEWALLTTPVTPGEYSRSVGALTHDVLLVVTVKISRVNSAVLFLKQSNGWMSMHSSSMRIAHSSTVAVGGLSTETPWTETPNPEGTVDQAQRPPEGTLDQAARQEGPPPP